MKSIDFRVMYFLIIYPSLSCLALWIERIAVKNEIVGSSLRTYNINFKNIFIFIIHHAFDLHDFTRLTYKVNAIEFILEFILVWNNDV